MTVRPTQIGSVLIAGPENEARREAAEPTDSAPGAGGASTSFRLPQKSANRRETGGDAARVARPRSRTGTGGGRTRVRSQARDDGSRRGGRT